MATPKQKPKAKSGPKETLHKIDLPFREAVGRLLSATPTKDKKVSRKPKGES
jgi:hypothetical protein